MELIPAGICGLMPGLDVGGLEPSTWMVGFCPTLYSRCKILNYTSSWACPTHVVEASLAPDSTTRSYIEELSERVLQAVQQCQAEAR